MASRRRNVIEEVEEMVRKEMIVKISEILTLIDQCENCKEIFHITMDSLTPRNVAQRREPRRCPLCRNPLNSKQSDLLEALTNIRQSEILEFRFPDPS